MPSRSGSVVDEAVHEQMLRRIRESDTYLPLMIEETDSMLRRWKRRDDEALRVYLVPSTLPAVTSRRLRAVRDAFSRWERVPEIPVNFVYVRDSSVADVQVRWIRQFTINRAGQADVTFGLDGWLRRGTLTLATHTPGPGSHPLDPDAVFTVALHEIGHLLGLGHSNDPRDVMAPTTTVHDLTLRDRRTAMLLYGLPPGSLRTPR